MFSVRVFLVWVLALNLFGIFGCGAPLLAQDEVEALKEIAETLGRPGWNLGVDPCSRDPSWVTPGTNDLGPNSTIVCTNCTAACHVSAIFLTRWNLAGMLPPQLARLPSLREIQLTRNYLNGSIPPQWASTQLQRISLGVNRLSGPIPKEIGKISTLTSLVIEANHLSGELPPELGNLTNLKRLIISSNNFTGKLPEALSKLSNLTDFRISDNRFTGKIPDFIQNWIELERLDIQGTDMEGPIPSGISRLGKLKQLIISDISGPESDFPDLKNMDGIKALILRNCNISGEIPVYIGQMKELDLLDLSFNKLAGRIPSTFSELPQVDFLYLTSNLLTGSVQDWMFNKPAYVDLSYNNFTWESPQPRSCQQGKTSGDLPCSQKKFTCSKYHYSLYINCGGDQVTINKNTTYEADQETSGASNFVSSDGWFLSSTGNFVNDNKPIDNYIAENQSILSMPNSELYTKARLSPISLTYGLCLQNGNYNVTLHFAEIMITDDRTYSSFGRRIFDVYIQGKVVLQDFNIKDEAGGSGREVVRNFTIYVADNRLEIRFIWAGKGTQIVPNQGTYGPLVSAISADPQFPRPKSGEQISTGIVVGIVASALFLTFLVFVFLWWKGCLGRKTMKDQDFRDLELQTGSYTLRQIRVATNNFDISNKIGEGGFGSVYKGLLPDGTSIAVKQLSSKSSQGNREFVNEIGMISALQHPNLVKLYGCCIEGDQPLLVYEYMENNSLARALFGTEEYQLQLDWTTRHKICVGIARGLAYLHEESSLKVVHRDIKATNVLLDRDLNPKISDFGLARLGDAEKTHISTRVAGTMGYMAPEYAMHGYLTEKADVYSFGVVALEIVSGKNITNFRPVGNHIHLVDWVEIQEKRKPANYKFHLFSVLENCPLLTRKPPMAYVLQERGSLLELFDPKLGLEFNEKEAIGMINVALLCTNVSPVLRPTMSAVVGMLTGKIDIQEPIQGSSFSDTYLKFKASSSCYKGIQRKSLSPSLSHELTLSMSPDSPEDSEKSTSASALYSDNLDSQYWSNR